MVKITFKTQKINIFKSDVSISKKRMIGLKILGNMNFPKLFCIFKTIIFSAMLFPIHYFVA